MITRAAIKRYIKAERAICENNITEYAARHDINGETPEFHKANREVHEAAKHVPGILRWFIDRRIIRELDYWNGTGQ